MMITKEHKLRIKRELKQAGATAYGLLKAESRYLPQIIHEDENIKAIVYGKTITKESAMIAATDSRIIYFNSMPFFSSLDEIKYEALNGITSGSSGGLMASVTLHTRVGNYTIRYTNLICARKFIKHIEKVCFDKTADNSDNEERLRNIGKKTISEAFMSKQDIKFLKEHEVGTVATMDRNGNLNSATIYYTMLDNHAIYILTKDETQKLHNIHSHPQVAFSAYDEPKMQTIQIQAVASIETDLDIKQKVFEAITKQRKYKKGISGPPVTKNHFGSFVVIKLYPSSVKFNDYSTSE